MVVSSSEEKSNGSAKPYSCGVFFIYHSLMIIIPCFYNFVNGVCTKKYSKNAEFLVAILCKTYTTALTDFSFFLRAIFRGETKNALCRSCCSDRGRFWRSVTRILGATRCRTCTNYFFLTKSTMLNSSLSL